MDKILTDLLAWFTDVFERLNLWYDGLREPRRFLILMGLTLIATLLLVALSLWAIPVWAFIAAWAWSRS